VTAWFTRVASIRVEPIGDFWAALSPLSGETLLLNDEGAAVLECLIQGPARAEDVAAALAADSGVPSSDIVERLAACWHQLVQAGLVRQTMKAPDLLL
jgi:PqqD family protein of HPr-rel-A system